MLAAIPITRSADTVVMSCSKAQSFVPRCTSARASICWGLQLSLRFETALLVTVGRACLQKFEHIDCLINNAGVFAGRQRELTKEGYELTYGINVQALYLVTCLLFSKVGFAMYAAVHTTHVHQSRLPSCMAAQTADCCHAQKAGAVIVRFQRGLPW